MSHWTYQGNQEFEIPENAFGFVYRITDLETGKKYIGRKYLTASKTTSKRVLKKDGTKVTKKKKSRVESDWQRYTGSCKPLNEQIQNRGKENFSFEILAFGFTKGQVNFLEEFCQMRSGAIFDETYYNDSVGARGFIGVKFTDEFKTVLRNIEL